MTPHAILLLAVLLTLALLGIEARRHDRDLRRIPLRIHVNGTRGKSTVVRLIASGLRAGGLRVVAKTTGSAARIILEDGTERPIVRPGRPSIGEQRWFLRWAAHRRVDAAVVECMAVAPEYQRTGEDALVRSQIGVITNVRPDHLEVFGVDLRRMAAAFGAAVPRGGTAVLVDDPYRPVIEAAARRRRCRVITVEPEAGDGDLFPENVALALAACRLAGVDANAARRAMRAAAGDPGAVAVRTLQVGGTSVTWINAFAANDPVSAALILRRCLAAPGRPPVVLYNHRADRPLRTRAFVPMLTAMTPGRVMVLGDHRHQLARRLVSSGLRAEAGMQEPRAVLRSAARAAGEGGVIVGLGNIAGIGMELTVLARSAAVD